VGAVTLSYAVPLLLADPPWSMRSIRPAARGGRAMLRCC